MRLSTVLWRLVHAPFCHCLLQTEGGPTKDNFRWRNLIFPVLIASDLSANNPTSPQKVWLPRLRASEPRGFESRWDKWIPPCEKWGLGTMPVCGHATHSSCHGTCLITTVSPGDCQHMTAPGILALAQPSLWGLRFRWGEWDCVLPEREGKGLCQPAAWANMQMYNTQLLTHCSSKHLSSCPLASISTQFSWEYSIGGLGTRLKVLPKLFNTY